MNSDWDEGDPAAPAVSARERLRSGTVDTPPPDMRRTRRAAGMLLLLAFVGVPSIGFAFIDSDGTTQVIVGLLLLAYLAFLGYLMVRTIRRR